MNLIPERGRLPGLVSAEHRSDWEEQLKPVCIGRIKDSLLLVRVFATKAEPVNGQFDMIAATLDETQVLSHVEADADQSADLDALQAALSDRTRERLAMRPHRRDLVFPLDPQSLYTLAKLKRHAGRGGLHARWASRDSSLRQMLPRDKESFRNHLSFAPRRHIDPLTGQFIAGQVLKAALTGRIDLPPDELGYLINAFVIYAYKGAETAGARSEDLTPELRALVFDALKRLPDGGEGVRDNADHLLVSINSAIWHFQVMSGDYDDAVRSLIAIFDNYKATETDRMPVNKSYNYCLSMLLYGIVLVCARREVEAQVALRASIECFRRAVANGTKTVTWFIELGDSHAAAACAFNIIDRIKTGEDITPEYLEDMARPAVRVRMPHYHAAVGRMIDHYLAHPEAVPANAVAAPRT